MAVDASAPMVKDHCISCVLGRYRQCICAHAREREQWGGTCRTGRDSMSLGTRHSSAVSPGGGHRKLGHSDSVVRGTI